MLKPILRGACSVLLLAAFLAAPARAEAPRLGIAEPPAKSPGAIRLATYNVLNLFDAHDDPSLSGDVDDLKSAKPESEKQAVAQIIRRLDADILALEEVESLDALVEFREAHLKGMGYDYVQSIGPGDERGIEQAVLSRFPIVEATVWPNIPLGGFHPPMFLDRPNRYAGQPLETRRSPLRVVIRVPATKTAGAAGSARRIDYELTLLIVHHKSGLGNDYWRDAEAAKFVSMMQELSAREPERNVAVLGDFNAVSTDQSVRAYLSAGFVDALGVRDPDDVKTITHESDRAIDFVLLNPALAREMVAGSAFVLGSPLRDKGDDYRTTPAPPGFASDHLPVAVDIVPRDR